MTPEEKLIRAVFGVVEIKDPEGEVPDVVVFMEDDNVSLLQDSFPGGEEPAQVVTMPLPMFRMLMGELNSRLAKETQ